MSLKRPYASTVRQNPKLDCPIPTRRGQDPVARTEATVPHAAFVSPQGSAVRRQVGGAPQPGRLVLRARGDEGVVGCDGYNVDVLKCSGWREKCWRGNAMLKERS